MTALSRRAAIGGALAILACPARAQSAPPRITLDPAIGVEHRYQVRYRLGRSDPGVPVGAANGVAVDYVVSVTAIALEEDRVRLRVRVSEVEWPDQGRTGADMVVTAAAMLDGLTFELVTGSRNVPQRVLDWPDLAGTLRERAMRLPGPAARSIGLSVIEGHDAQQVSWHLTRALDGMGFARSYLSFARSTGASTISWFGSPIDVTVQPTGQGGATVEWAAPGAGGRGPATSFGYAELRADGLADYVLATFADGGAQRTFRVEALPAR